MPRRGGNIYKRKDGRWEARYAKSGSPNGKYEYQSVYGVSYTQVKEKLEALKRAPTPQQKPHKITVEELCKEWLEVVQVGLKKSSYARYHNVTMNHIIPSFPKTPVTSLTNTLVNALIKEKSISGRLDGMGGLSAKTVHDIVSILKQIIQYAEQKHYLSGFDYKLRLPKQRIAEIPVLTPTEQERLVRYIQQDLNSEKLGILLSLYAGVRLGELCALQWQDINFETGSLMITKTLQRIKDTDNNAPSKTKIVIDSPKSLMSVRTIPLSTFLLKTLKQYEKLYRPTAYVLTGKASRFIEPRLYEKKFKGYLVNAKVEEINFHALRHTFATRAIEQHVDGKSLSEILGHASVEFTLKRYVHSSKELQRVSMEKLAVCY